VRTRAGNFLANNKLFAVIFALGTALRLITMLGFPPAIWFGGDSASYINSGLHMWPGVSRESGYGVMLEILHPFHSFFVVTMVQHLLGLAMGVMIYALLRHRYRLPAWGAALAALPVLLDVYMIQLEQEILADSTFTVLCVAAIVLVLWWPDAERPGWSLPAAGALLAIASAFWPVGLPLLIVLLAYMVIRRIGWMAVVATLVAGAIPLLAYASWYDVRYHQFAFNSSNGVFLWSRTMSFADCAVIKPPADLRPLCPTQPVAARPSAPFYIWEANSPLLSIGTGSNKFSHDRNSLAQKFAIKAIEAQPLSFARTVVQGWLLTYDWDRPNVPSAAMASRYQFTTATQTTNALSGTTAQDVAMGKASLHAAQRAYTGGSTADTREVQPFADIMIDYQKVFYLRGTMIAVLMLIGLGGVIIAWRRDGFGRLRNWGGPALFPFVAALTMQIVPPLTADFSLRYVVPTIPVACLAAALAFARPLAGSRLAAVAPQPAGAAQPAEVSQSAEPAGATQPAGAAQAAVPAQPSAPTAPELAPLTAERMPSSESTGQAGNTA
jgi:hypothetical protein